MGVDIGTLEAVFMRNVPPSPSNYIQRAGRAGRGPGSSAFVVTFCNVSPHDREFFNHPEEMISGKVRTPIVKVSNPKIAVRHISATALAFFWKSLGESPKKIADMLDTGYLESFKEYLDGKPEDLDGYVGAFVPEDIAYYDCEDVRIDLKGHGWHDYLFGDRGRLSLMKSEFDQDIDALRLLEKEYAGSKNYRGAGRINDTINTVEGEYTLSCLSRGNVIPKYGFPVDIVSLESGCRYGSDRLNLQRDLGMAILDYAPGCEVIADGNIVESGYVKRVEGKEWDVFGYAICPECRKISIKRYDENEKFACCGAEQKVKRFLVPKFGFQFHPKKKKKAGFNRPRKAHGMIQHYLGSGESREEFAIGSLRGFVSRRMDEILTLSKDEYFVCGCCGHGRSRRTREKLSKHDRPCGGTCNGGYEKYALGYKFRTDVCVLHFERQAREDAKASVLYALIEGLSSLLNIERNELQGVLSSEGHYVFFDNTPGGSGYAKFVSPDETIVRAIERALRIVEGCDCDENGACYSCLKNYRNQKDHANLNRKAAAEYLRGLLEDAHGE
jgi:hypothetical protein